MFHRKRVGYHRLRRRSVSRFTDPHQPAAHEQHRERRRQSAAHARQAPEQHSGRDDGVLAKTIRQVTRRDARQRQHDQQHRLQRPQLRVGHPKMLPQQRQQRIQHLAIRKVDKIDQSKYSKETHLRSTERHEAGHHWQTCFPWCERPGDVRPERLPEAIGTEEDYIPRMSQANRSTSTSDRLTTVLSYGALLLLGYLVFLIIAPFLVPLAWSAVLGIFFFPVFLSLTKRTSLTKAALLSTLGVTLVLIVPVLMVLPFAGREAVEITVRLRSQINDGGLVVPASLADAIRSHLPQSLQDVDFMGSLQQAMEKVASYLAGS